MNMKKTLACLLTGLAVVLSAAEKELAAWYPMDGNFNDASGNGHHLKALGEKTNFSVDTQLKSGKSTVYGPLRAGEGSGASGNIPGINLEKGLTLMGFYRHGNSNSGGIFAGFGSLKWKKAGYLINIPYGIPTVKTGDGGTVRFQRLPSGRWTHLALVIPPGTGTGEYKFYIGGKRVEAKGKKQTVVYLPCPSEFMLGEGSGKAPAGKCFDEIKVYNRALPDAEIADAAKMTGKAPPRTSFTGGKRNRISIPRFQPPKKVPPIRGITHVRLLDASNLAVTGYYQKFLQERFKTDCWPFLKQLDTFAHKVQDWSRVFHYNFAGTELMHYYRRIIGGVYSDPAGFTLTVNGKKREWKRSGYWINPISASRFPDAATGKETVVKGGEILHCKYMELESPLKEGDRCEITNTLGEKMELVYSGKLRSDALKVNQVGYAADAGRKYAYLGIWRGPELGSRDYSAWNGRDFMLLDAESGREVFRGKIVGRIPDSDFVAREKNGGESRIPFSGEDVYELDFSEFNTPGHYRIMVPGVGSSWDFKIGNDAVGEAFYVRMRGMYQKRCGIAKDPKCTHWPDAACHMITYQGNFPPNAHHYWSGKKDGNNFGFFNERNERVSVKPFDVIRRNCTARKIAKNVYGGWHDAADYDRRPYHSRAVEAFTSAYLMFPQNFSDGQLNLPESGNGVPDILDEAVWGADVWRRAQNPDGSVGNWIETTAHPGNGSIPGKDPMPYFLSFPTRESTAEYTADAAALALALKKAGDAKRSVLFLESAKKGYEFAVDPSKRKSAVLSALVAGQKGQKSSVQTLIYREDSEIASLPVGKAAFNLYILTGEKRYLKDFKKYYKKGIGQYIRNLHWNLSPFYFAELGTEGADRPEFAKEFAEFEKKVVAVAESLLKQLNGSYSYRTPWYPSNHPYVTHMAWGNGHPMNRGISFAAAWYLTKDPKYRDAALLCNDWQLGTNPLGRSMTSGLGKVYPVRFLDLPSQVDGIVEYVPGITPYTHIFRLDYNSILLSYGLYRDPRRDHDFAGVGFALLPFARNGEGEKTPQQVYTSNVVRAVPVFRRFGNVENWSVSTSEYTVWETIAPEAALTGCLLNPGWMPSKELKDRKPVDDVVKLHGLMAMP